MKTFALIYGMIIIMAVLSTVSEKYVRKHEIKVSSGAAAFFAAYYFVVCSFRSVMSNGSEYLSTSFAGKGMSGYLKVAILLIGVYLVYTFLGIKVRELLRRIIGVFTFMLCFKIVGFSYPNMMHIFLMGVLSIIIGTVLYFMRDNKTVQYLVKEQDNSGKIKTVAVRLSLFAVLFLLEGPIELYAYNQGDFVFGFGDMLADMLAGSLILIVIGTLLISEYLHGLVFDTICYAISTYSILSYVQAMFLNGKMKRIDGGFQTWEKGQIIVNLIAWIVIAVVILVIELGLEKGKKALNTTSFLLTLLLVWSCVSVLITSGVFGEDKRQLVTDDMFTVSGDNDVIVLMLDAYDVQMMKEVLESNPDYLKPLKDFTYYDNMRSSYVYTDGELPYLFTGVEEDIGERTNKEYIDDLYSKGNFWENVAKDNCDIRVMTDCKYVAPVEDGIIANFTTACKCSLDVDKTVSQMSECIRYKSAPFRFKPDYHYEAYAFTNIIEDTNVYLFGTDYAFESSLLDSRIKKTEMSKTFRFYHLYGAHAAYYLTEDATLDYSSTPLAQWKGCLKIVYDYIEALKAIDAYDEATIIIMADHGLNNTNRVAAKEYGYDFTDETNPIFFVKRSNEQHDELQTDHKQTSHKVFFATVLKGFDETDTTYGDAIWE